MTHMCSNVVLNLLCSYEKSRFELGQNLNSLCVVQVYSRFAMQRDLRHLKVSNNGKLGIV